MAMMASPPAHNCMVVSRYILYYLEHILTKSCFVFTQEWVPVIRRDGNRQRRQAPTTTALSDAYMNGMPAKKRKVTTFFNLPA